MVESKSRVIPADGLRCPHCGCPINFITPYYGRDECDLDNQTVGVRTWWIFVPFIELISVLRAWTGNTPGAVKKLYHCVKCNVDLSYKEAVSTSAENDGGTDRE